MPIKFPAAWLLALSAIGVQADPLIDALNADKTRIAEAFKSASQACTKKPAKQVASCRKEAEQTRRDALHAAMAERDAGLKCRDTCGRVTEIKQIERDGEGSALGTVGGGIAGAVIGRKLAGDGSSASKNVATAAGAVGGALLGKKIEQKLSKQQVWVTRYQLYNGTSAEMDSKEKPALAAGDRIELREGKLVKR
ncbi:glycine zipper 2TM domain-containing protein [Chitinimonas sp. BJYL2]|uniref:glycine zipper 2TM domain-containing protein n=1 Tax=Chitinimonas sp. BJYL2 TaxID=2976696 RepID=UPI0022B55835|nr:glycine zipper 2TM domain-containing protein [Chitinimonas sp. BJYL2]